MVKLIIYNWRHRLTVAEKRHLIVRAVEELIIGVMFFVAFALGMHALAMLVDAWMAWCCG